MGSRDVVVVDEAGMVGSRQMADLVTRVAAAGAKLVLVGDPEQLQAIEAGAAFRLVAERVGPVSLCAVSRQREAWQQDATRELATGRTADALARYDRAGMVRAADSMAEARAALVAEWDAQRRSRPQDSRIMLAPTRAEVAALNDLARRRLRDAGELGPEHAVLTGRGERAMAAGDRVMFLRNERALGAKRGVRAGVPVKNGTLGTLMAVRDEGGRQVLCVRLDGRNGAAGPEVTFSTANYAELDHGYAATVHKAQGMTVERAHVLATAAMDRHSAYVALSRHRAAVTLHYARDQFANMEALAARLGRERLKDTSLDYALAAAPEQPYAARRSLVPDSEIVVAPRPEELRQGREAFRAAYEDYRADRALAAAAERWLRDWSAAWGPYRLRVHGMTAGETAPTQARAPLCDAVRRLSGPAADGLRRHVAEQAAGILGADAEGLRMVQAVLRHDEGTGSRERMLTDRLDALEEKAGAEWQRWQVLRERQRNRDRRPSPSPSPW